MAFNSNVGLLFRIKSDSSSAVADLKQLRSTAESETDAIKNSFNKTTNATDDATAATKRLDLSLTKIGSSLTSVGKNLSVALTAPLLAIGGLGVKAALEFDAVRTKITALLGDADTANKKIAELRNLANNSVGVTQTAALDTFAQLKGIGGIADITINKLIGSLGKLNAAFKIDDLAGFNQNLNQIFTQGFERSDIKEAIGRVPIFEQLLESAFGTADGEKLKKLKESGKLTLDGFLSGLSEGINNDPRIGNITENLTGKLAKGFERANLALAPLGEIILNAVVPALEALAPYIEKLSTLFSSLSPTMQGVIIGVGAFLAALGPALIVIGSVITGITAITGAVAALGGLSAILPVIAAVVVAVTLLSAEIVLLYKAWQTNFGGIRDITKKVFDAVYSTVSTVIKSVKAITESVVGDIVDFWQKNYPLIRQTVETVSNAVKNIVQSFLGIIRGLWQDYGTQISAIVSETWSNIKGIIFAVVDLIQNVIKLGMQAINGDWSGAWETFKDIVTNAIEIAVGSIKTIVGASVSILRTLGTVLFQYGGEALGLLGKAVVAGIAFVVDQFINLPFRLVQLLPKLVIAAVEIGGAIWEGIKRGFLGGQAKGLPVATPQPTPKPTTQIITPKYFDSKGKQVDGSGGSGAGAGGADKATKSTADNRTDKQVYKDFVGELKKLGVTINSGFRTYAQQAALFAKLPAGQAARPGTSDHEFYKAVDLPPGVSQAILNLAAKRAGVTLDKRNVHEGTGLHNHQGFQKGKSDFGGGENDLEAEKKKLKDAADKKAKKLEDAADKQAKIEDEAAKRREDAQDKELQSKIKGLDEEVSRRESANKVVLSQQETLLKKGEINEQRFARVRAALDDDLLAKRIENKTKELNVLTNFNIAEEKAFEESAAKELARAKTEDRAAISLRLSDERAALFAKNFEEEKAVKIELQKLDDDLAVKAQKNRQDIADGAKKSGEERKKVELELYQIRLDVLQAESDLADFRAEQNRKTLANTVEFSFGKARIRAIEKLRQFDIAETERKRAARIKELDEEEAAELEAADKELKNEEDFLIAELELHKKYKLLRDGVNSGAAGEGVNINKGAKADTKAVNPGGVAGLGQLASEGLAGLIGGDSKTALAAMGPIADTITNSFGQMAQAVGDSVKAFVLFGGAGGSFKKFAAEMIASLAQMAAVQAVFELAQGFATLALAFFGVPQAAGKATAHFTAAAVFGGIAGVALVAGRGVAGNSFANQAATATGGSSGNLDLRRNQNTGGRNSSSSPSSGTSGGAYSGESETRTIEENRFRNRDSRATAPVEHNTLTLRIPSNFIEREVISKLRGRGELHKVFVELIDA